MLEWIVIDSVEADGSYWYNGYADLLEEGYGYITLLWNTENKRPYAYVCWHFSREIAKRWNFDNPKEEVRYPDYLCIENEGTEDESYTYPVVVPIEIVDTWAELGGWLYEGREAEEILKAAKEASIYLRAVHEKGEWVLKTYDRLIGDYREVTPVELAEALGFKHLRRS